MVGINEFYGWVASHGGHTETRFPENWADVSVGIDALAEFIELARQDGMNDAKKNTGYLGEKPVEYKTFTLKEGHTDKFVEDTFKQVFEAVMTSEEEEVDRKEFIKKMLIHAGEKALFEKCVIDTTPIAEDGKILDKEQWLRKAIWKVPDWLSKDELADLLYLETGYVSLAYEKLRNEAIIGNAHE